MPPFNHAQAAHCESGVVSKLLNEAGFELSEPMAFGLSGCMTFAYLPFVKVSGMPLIAYRMLPGTIIRGVQKKLGIKFSVERFKTPAQARAALDEHLKERRPVGAQAGVFWLPYFPPEMRFHFNAHNLIIYGKEGDEYLISDPVFDYTTKIEASALDKARFAKGVFAPKGVLYHPSKLPERVEWATVIAKAVRSTARMMLYSPLPVTGVKGMERLAKRIEKLDRADPRYAKLFLGHIVRMQEEIGTGGGGFRFMYAAFLEEGARKCANDPVLLEASHKMTAAGDAWRDFALLCAKGCKSKTEINYKAIAESLRRAASLEREVYGPLRGFKPSKA